jgi:hypothetical protein
MINIEGRKAFIYQKLTGILSTNINLKLCHWGGKSYSELEKFKSIRSSKQRCLTVKEKYNSLMSCNCMTQKKIITETVLQSAK